ncbi:MAG: 4-hydroxy-tetrahydrodipicolinate reductase [Flavobacteriales bacterium]|uniref:4-hydroxy-tetrahydrodipicolinate reductase n=1 Tax=Blattabacterium sp. (Mastotermes darwiniensis) TaxID=39768 RepID=UPI000231DE12|nr:4-hydroxy-tetrahydrodipicolinate reductase [Blattabacterium sp. (Mastotermes darwiniensis)]AER40582.1 dihydrodipicolinate reductase [Blattabacterium sp. (Mastotermes darwiniensis) str. MADAR]MDR1805079.1 4-hydroxy-tetrahydrodipicolinate reductase [Flavobacteriales bacterium]
MNIAIIGYGKMGKSIEKIAKVRNHKISFFSNKSPCPILLKKSDVAIEFSRPDSAFKNIKICIENHIPIVCGTTGWIEKLHLVKDLCEKNNGTFLYSSNFSIGMNIFHEINHKLSKLLSPYSINYEVKIEEIHHKEKLDKPSGTALVLAKSVLNNQMKKTWTLDPNKKKDKILIVSKRIENIPGIHIVTYQSKMESIEMQHKAHNRDVFAIGAIIAAEWIKDKKGIFSMKEVLGI